MIVPDHWAEAQLRARVDGRQVTVRRFGWSLESEADAELLAEERARAALQRIESGEKLFPREPKVPYNGADGVPIREEVVSRHGESVVTRNSYGALCLNTPCALFADVDFDDSLSCAAILVVAAALFAAAYVLGNSLDSGLAMVGLFLVALLAIEQGVRAVTFARRKLLGDPEVRAKRRIARFMAANPDWRLAIYRTPAGLRVLALQRAFDPNEPLVERLFAALGVDPIYRTMCLKQRCFRARLTAKPWRIGISTHLRPRPGVWPVSPERRPERDRWLREYDEAARGFAACRFEIELGNAPVDDDIRRVRELHDELARATSGLPIA